MKSRLQSLLKLRNLLPASPYLIPLPKCFSSPKSCIFMPTTYSTICLTQQEGVGKDTSDQPEDSVPVLKRLGCSDADIAKIFTKASALKHADIDQLNWKLELLTGLGLTAPEMVKIVCGRPRILVSRLTCFAEQLKYFNELFGSRELLVRAILRNPSLLTYDLHKTIKPTIEMYRVVGLDMKDLIQMILARPTLISRTSFSEEKMEFIRKTGVSKTATMYKYVVTLIGVSRLETIRQKIANFEKFGMSEEEIFCLFGKSPYVMSLSIDKVQRNMTFILSQLKLPAKIVLDRPSLLYLNLENVMKPRALLAGKMHEMGLEPQITGPMILTVMRMNEKRFLKAFVSHQPMEVADELMEYYENVKGVKRLAEASKKNCNYGFPF
ncbi:putative transcription regulator mTERF family [Rosa chinensis]|uniref:Putative transcription regulator mTERF family n=2 Tax=Rosa chinensis TaxID=74649 RepID=A0A2P6Q8E4_ROSCH|nr:putative transcription regulator mTERF family [Rosa chinensis]